MKRNQISNFEIYHGVQDTVYGLKDLSVKSFYTFLSVYGYLLEVHSKQIQKHLQNK
jgi:hypothetical protein